MDQARSDALKRELADVPEEEQLVSLERFFDGNDDLGSIGCNLAQHPGMAIFRDVLERVGRAPGVEAVWVEISELDPGEDCWPFSERVLVVGTVAEDALRQAVSILQPDDVWVVDPGDIPAPISSAHPGTPVLAIWWD